MYETAAIKDKSRDEKVARKKERAEEEKRKRITKEIERKEQKAKFAAAMTEKKRLEKEEKDRKRAQRTTEGWKAYQKRIGRKNTTRTRDFQLKVIEKQEREVEEARRYLLEKARQTGAKAALGNSEEESRKRERERSRAYARKVASDQRKKLERELNRLEDKRAHIEDDLGLRC